VAKAPPPRLHLGGPDRPPRALRDLLQQRIEAVPAGGEIAWATYYFRDRELARALIAASDRGVAVRLCVEGRPRCANANNAVLALLGDHGLRGGLHVHRARLNAVTRARPHLHSKIYHFSHPDPHVLVGSFNPSGDLVEDEAVLAEIGDQDRGHNLLAELHDPKLVRRLRDHLLGFGRRLPRWRPSQNRRIPGEAATAWLYPRLRPDIVEARVRALPAGARVTGALSHLKESSLTRILAAAADSGVAVQLIVHETERRVPTEVVEGLTRAGVAVVRHEMGWRLPMHAKFLVLDEANGSSAFFGSMNFNRRSRWYNHEILLETRHPLLIDGLRTRYAEIEAEVRSS
jgi:phosphatidylserine/phosphatidylglycerophosphate/cardiolipin synthase-like enzyme